MSSSEPIGGYFGLEPASDVPTQFPYSEAVLLNSARNCLEFILANQSVSKVYMPAFTCEVIFEPLQKLGVAYELYEVDEQLELTKQFDLAADELLLYTNYFGVKDAYCWELSTRYGEQLVVDAAQAFFFKALTSGHTFYSPRKFFGVADGGCLVTSLHADVDYPIDDSSARNSHLTIRLEKGAEAGYQAFKQNDDSLSGEPTKHMSPQTREQLQHIDYEAVRTRRRQNLDLLHEKLSSRNQLKLDLNNTDAPMVYPYWTDDLGLRQRLIDQKIFVATYWPNVLESSDESSPAYQQSTHTLPLPIDQRYDATDMQRILEHIDGSNT